MSQQIEKLHTTSKNWRRNAMNRRNFELNTWRMSFQDHWSNCTKKLAIYEIPVAILLQT